MTIDEARQSIRDTMKILYTHGIAIKDLSAMGQILAHHIPSSEWDENITAVQALLWSLIHLTIVSKSDSTKPSVTFTNLFEATQSPQGFPAVLALLQYTIELITAPYSFL